jgi:DNA-binding NarL/FixJ family response regulator
LEVVGEAGDGDSAVVAAQELVPDVVLLDVRMPVSGGIETARALRDLVPTTKVVMLTVSDEDDDLYEALRAGASGYLLKGEYLQDIGASLKAICAGRTVLSSSVAAKITAEFSDENSIAQLSGREVQVLRLVAEGQENKEIAERFELSTHTVKRHIANILSKLHQRSRFDAARYAVDRDLLH